MRRSIVIGGFLATCWALAVPAWAQRAAPMELGAQFATMRLSGLEATDAGIGARFAWNVTDTFALEAVSDFFPTGRGNVLRGGRKFNALFGPKVGWRADRIGVFGKTRAGIARVGEGRQFGVCILIFPPPESCYVADTRLAFDVGGVLEFYPTERSSLRLDVGDLVTRLGRSSARFPRRSVAHDLQVAAGVGLRF